MLHFQEEKNQEKFKLSFEFFYVLWKMEHLENGAYIFKHMIFQRRQKALLWSILKGSQDIQIYSMYVGIYTSLPELLSQYRDQA